MCEKLLSHFRAACDARARYTEPSIKGGAIDRQALAGAKRALIVADFYMRESYRDMYHKN
jgi:hypothetical protein